MNDKDKEAFEKWYASQDKAGIFGNDDTSYVELAWQAACEYKQKEYSNIMDAMTRTSQNNAKLQAENAKLKECVEFYANKDLWDNNCHCTSDSEEDPDCKNHPKFRTSYGGKRARQVLKELEEE